MNLMEAMKEVDDLIEQAEDQMGSDAFLIFIGYLMGKSARVAGEKGT